MNTLVDTVTLQALFTDLADDLAVAAATARAAAACAEAGAVREAVRIALDLDITLSDAQGLHATLCLLARRARLRADPARE